MALKQDPIVSKCNQSHSNIFQFIFINLFFPLTFSRTGWFRNYRFWDGLQFFLPFNSRFLDVDGQKLCEKSALHATTLLKALHSCLMSGYQQERRRWKLKPPTFKPRHIVCQLGLGLDGVDRVKPVCLEPTFRLSLKSSGKAA
jgi:hypothetical protein